MNSDRSRQLPSSGSLSIATPYTQARYFLSKVVATFIEHYPQVNLSIHGGSPNELARLAEDGTVDFAIATEAIHVFEGLVVLPCYRWNRAIETTKNHPLAKKKEKIALADVNEYPILTYVFGFTGRSKLDEAFQRQGLQPRVALTATDTGVFKTYIRAGLGIGIIAKSVYDPKTDNDLICIDAAHLFAPSVTSIAFRRGSVFRAFHYDCIRLLHPICRAISSIRRLNRLVTRSARNYSNRSYSRSMTEPAFTLPLASTAGVCYT